MSSIIPILFFLRIASNDDYFFLWYKLSLPESLDPPFDFLPDFLSNYADELRQKPRNHDDEWLESDVVELHHCRSILTMKNNDDWWNNFTSWAHPLVNESLRQIQLPKMEPGDKAVLQQEIVLELLELYGTEKGDCDFHLYRPTVSRSDLRIREALLETADVDVPEGLARCAFVIAIHKQDIDHIKRLVKAIHMNHHLIVLYLENQENNKFASDVSKIASDYENVVVLQFGRKLGGAVNPMSRVHLKIMRWLTIDLELEYDYHITLDGASYPLYRAEELATRLMGSGQSLWLGALTEQGRIVHDSQKKRLVEKQLLSTSIGKAAKLGPVFPSQASSLPDLNQKTTSGSYAIFSRSLIRRLLRSSKALRIFAMTKYACCTTNIDNYNWIAAFQLLSASDSDLDLPQVLQEARMNTAMFQVFGGVKGDTNCEKVLHPDNTEQSAILSIDASTCFRIEHPLVVNAVPEGKLPVDSDWTIPRNKLSFHGGDKMLEHIRSARKSGFLFARQFESKNPQSMAVLNAIEKEWA